jgi:hypothetical protein
MVHVVQFERAALKGVSNANHTNALRVGIGHSFGWGSVPRSCYGELTLPNNDLEETPTSGVVAEPTEKTKRHSII